MAVHDFVKIFQTYFSVKFLEIGPSYASLENVSKTNSCRANNKKKYFIE